MTDTTQTQRMMVDVSANLPILWMDVNADDFGRIFSHMADNEQVAVFAAMVKHMSAHPSQWDYISIELDKPENKDLRVTLKIVFEEMEHD